MQSGIVEAAQLGGWLVFHDYDSRRSTPGFPDLVLVRPPEVMFFELKDAGGRVNTEQADWIEQLQACGVVTAAVIRPAGYDAVLKHLARPRPRTEVRNGQ